MRKFFRFTYYAGIIVLFVAVVLIGFTQTKAFRSSLRQFIIENVSPSLNGELRLGQLEGNLISSFQIDNIELLESGKKVLFVEKMEVRYDPLAFLVKRVSITRVTLVNPHIALIRSSDSTWNVNRLIKPTPSDSIPSQWVIELKEIEVKNARFLLVDSLALVQQVREDVLVASNTFNYANLQLGLLNINAAVTIRAREIAATIKSLSFQSDHPGVVLHRLSGEFSLTPVQAEVNELRIETPKSLITVSAKLGKTNITKIKDLSQLERSPVSLSLKVDKLDFNEFEQFVGQSVDFLANDVSCQLDAEGTFGSLNIKNFALHTAHSVIQSTGTITNLHQPKDLELNLTCLNNKIEPQDVLEHLPGLKILDLTSLGAVKYDLWLKGKPALFKAQLSANSKAGKVELDGTFDTREEELIYDGVIRTAHLDLRHLLDDENLESKLNATITVKGSGTNIRTLTSTVQVAIDSSEFYGLPVGQTVIALDAAGQTLRSRVSASISSSRLEFNGTLKFQPHDLDSYQIDGKASSLNVADFMKEKRYASDLSFDLHAEGTGLTYKAMRGNLDVNFSRSSFGKESFQKGGLTISLNTSDPSRQQFRFTSDIATLEVLGKFTPPSFIAAITQGSKLIGEAVRHQFVALDSLRASSSKVAHTEFQSRSAELKEPVDAQFTLQVTNGYAVGVVLGEKLDGSFGAKGTVTGTREEIRFESDVDIERFRFTDESVQLGLRDSGLKVKVGGLSRASVLKSLATSVQLRAHSLSIDSLPFFNVAADVQSKGTTGTYQVSALIDSVTTIGLKGTSRADSGSVVFNVEQLKIGINGYDFENAETIHATLGKNGFRIDNLSMRHETEELNASGYFDPAGVSDLRFSVKKFLLNNMQSFYKIVRPDDGRPILGGILNAEGHFGGTFENPNYSLMLGAEGVRYRETVFGQVQATLSYSDMMLNAFTQLRSRPQEPSAKPDLLISGTMPYDFSLKKTAEQKLKGEMDLKVQTSALQMEFLEPFIPELSNMTGTVMCDIKLGGTIESPSYEGSLTLQGARFLFGPLNIQYIVDGKLVPHGRQIALENLTVSNIPQDRPDGKMNFSGTFTLAGLQIKDFDLLANGQLLVMKESSRRPGQSFYGDLFGATGPNGIQWKGEPSKSFMSGTLLIKYASLTFPPIRQAQELRSNKITVSYVDDRPKASLDSIQSPNRISSIVLADARRTVSTSEEFSTTSLDTLSSKRPSEQASVAQQQLAPKPKSFLDYIVYDLIFETQGATQVRFIFNNLTNEELFGDLKGRAIFAKAGDQTRLTGEVELGKRSYYNSIFKKLDATGKLNFTGDAFNPELNVTAKYEGMYRSRNSGDTSKVTPGTLNGSNTDEPVEQKVVVTLLITGTRDKPTVKTELARYDLVTNRELKQRADPEADALSFLVSGSFKDELTQQERASLFGNTMLLGLTSSVLSGPLSDFLRKEFGVIKSVDVIYYGGSFQESADVRLTGEVGDAVIRLGGKVFNDINNANISVQLPMSGLLGSEKWRNLVLELERRVEGVETLEQRRESKGLRLLYRIIF
ncbi:MAG: hypothetical protein HY088_04760 [Ignavibacteriales bacterium]|nr:hypothetical protein [Ignavibacteriales bacterium]